MSDGKISPNILEKIRKNSEPDELLADFLRELISEESSHTGSWWWKETYKKLIKKYSKKWGTTDEA